MLVNPIKEGIVLDHISAGTGMKLYKVLRLNELECPVAIITNAFSAKMGKKDIIKIDGSVELDLDVIGYMDPGVTVNKIENSVVVERKHLSLPETISEVIHCKNPRCITSIEQELPHRFKLVDRENKVYRCIYCEAKSK